MTMRLRSLRDPDEYIELPRWLPTSIDLRHLEGKRVMAAAGYGGHHYLEVGFLHVDGPNAEGHFAVDLSFPCPGSATSLKAYIYYLSQAQLDRLTPVDFTEYEFIYDGVLYADHPFISSFTEQMGMAASGAGATASSAEESMLLIS